MDIRDQMTATVRLTKQAAQRLDTFLSGLAARPKNMNDALNLALSELPVQNFRDEAYRLQQDRGKSILDIKARFDSTGFLTRSDYYFLVLVAKDAAGRNKKQRVEHSSIRSVLEMTLDLWSLCQGFDPDGHEERYMLGNIGGSRADGRSASLRDHIPWYIEHTRSRPFPGALEFAMRNPEVMLRDELSRVDESLVNDRMQKHFLFLHRAALRWYYLEHGRSLYSDKGADPFERTFAGNFGKDRCLHVSQIDSKNIGLMFSLSGDNSIVLAANNVVEVEELIYAFLDRDTVEPGYKGPGFWISAAPEGSSRTGHMIQVPRLRFRITDEDFDAVAEALSEMLADPAANAALTEAWDRFGKI